MGWELWLPPVRAERNRRTGRFLKGRIPSNKGKTWDEYMPKSSQRRCRKGWKNLAKYRPKVRPETAGKSKRKCVVVSDEGRFRVFEFAGEAAAWLGVGRMENIARCCRQNESRHAYGKTGSVNTDHRYMGYRWYYYSDKIWLLKAGERV